MPWFVLLASAVLEAVWATALGASDGLSRPGPTVVFAIALAGSMAGLGWAMRRIGLGTAYAVWVGVGAAFTVGWVMLTGTEPATPLRLAFLAGIVGCVVGLKLAGHAQVQGPTAEPATAASAAPSGARQSGRRRPE